MCQKKQDREILNATKNFKTVSELSDALVNAVLAKGGTWQHLRNVLSDESLQQKIADLIVSADAKINRPLGENECLVHVTYEPIPPPAELELQYGEKLRTNIFDGRQFHKHRSCKEMDETPIDRIFHLQRFGWAIEPAEVIAEMEFSSYRPATHLEAYAFFKAYPDMRVESSIVALGSFAYSTPNNRHALVLEMKIGGMFLYSCTYDGEFDPSYLFLCVRS